MKSISSVDIRQEIYACLNRLRSLTDDLARRAVEDGIAGLPPSVGIVRKIAMALETTPELICEHSNEAHIVINRQICQYVMRTVAKMSYPRIGRATGSRHHTTVLHSCQKIERMRTENEGFNVKVQDVCDTLMGKKLPRLGADIPTKGAQGEIRHAQTVQAGAD